MGLPYAMAWRSSPCTRWLAKHLEVTNTMTVLESCKPWRALGPGGFWGPPRTTSHAFRKTGWRRSSCSRSDSAPVFILGALWLMNTWNGSAGGAAAPLSASAPAASEAPPTLDVAASAVAAAPSTLSWMLSTDMLDSVAIKLPALSLRACSASSSSTSCTPVRVSTSLTIASRPSSSAPE